MCLLADTDTVSAIDSSGQLQLQGMGKRRVEAAFDAGRTTSDGGVVVLRELALRSRLIATFAACFTDHRNQALIEHSIEELVGQRVIGIACGYEDLNDHDTLRDDPVLAMAAGKKDPTGLHRKRKRDRGHGLAGKSTLNRLELTPSDASAESRYKKIVYNQDEVDRFFVDAFLDAHAKPPRKIILDLDATDDPLHGKQEGRFFHGYYRCYCYLPLYIFCGDHLLCARLRCSNIDGAHGALDEVKRIVAQIRTRWPKVKIILRADSGFARDELMDWCERNRVDFVFGLAKNKRLKAEIKNEMAQAEEQHAPTEMAARTVKASRSTPRPP